nr:MAG TPA: hypothetical protein [Caudoviricetes sp.]
MRKVRIWPRQIPVLQLLLRGFFARPFRAK